MSPGVPPPPPHPGMATDKCITILGWTHLQHTCIAVAFAAGIFIGLGLNITKKIPAARCDSSTLMLKINPP